MGGQARALAGQRMMRRLERCGKPVVAAVNGFALGGGCELAMACHIRIASDTARFGQPEVKLGLGPGYGGTVRLPRLVGRGRALELLLTGAMIDAPEAWRIGLVNRVVSPDRLLAGIGGAAPRHPAERAARDSGLPRPRGCGSGDERGRSSSARGQLLWPAQRHGRHARGNPGVPGEAEGRLHRILSLQFQPATGYFSMVPARSIRWAALAILAGCGQRDRLTFPTENPGDGDGPTTEITQPAVSDTGRHRRRLAHSAGSHLRRRRGGHGLLRGGRRQPGVCPDRRRGADTVDFALQLSTLNNGGGTVNVRALRRRYARRPGRPRQPADPHRIVRFRQLVARGFRNLADLDCELPPSGLVLLGANAQGKTNLLEAIYYPVLFRSFRGRGGSGGGPVRWRRASMSKRSRTAARSARSAPATRALGQPQADRGRRAGARAGWRTPPARGWRWRSFRTTWACRGGRPPERRRYLDRLLSLAHRRYLRALARYRAALAQRNSALRQGSIELARAFDAPLAAAGAELVAGRRPLGGRRGRPVRRRARVPGRAGAGPGSAIGAARAGGARGVGPARSPRRSPRDQARGMTTDRARIATTWSSRSAAGRCGVRVDRPAARCRGGAQADRAGLAQETPAAPSPRCCWTMSSPSFDRRTATTPGPAAAGAPGAPGVPHRAAEGRAAAGSRRCRSGRWKQER